MHSGLLWECLPAQLQIWAPARFNLSPIRAQVPYPEPKAMDAATGFNARAAADGDWKSYAARYQARAVAVGACLSLRGYQGMCDETWACCTSVSDESGCTAQPSDGSTLTWHLSQPHR